MKRKKKNINAFILLAVLLIGVLFIGIYFGKSYKPMNRIKTNSIFVSIPIGSYSAANITSNDCGIATESGIVGSVDDLKSFNDPHRYLAQLIWFGSSGYLEYKVKNPLPNNSKVKSLNLFFEACSEAPSHDLNHKTDISIYINGKKIGTHTITGDFGGKRGKYTPKWWPIDNSQYGKPIFVEVTKEGTYIGDSYNSDWAEKLELKINFKKVSNVSIDDLNLSKDFITIRIGVDKDAKNKGGMNIFGENFGNYHAWLELGLDYVGKKIYQPKIIEIINNPKSYENKTVILIVHPGGWSCPVGKATEIPEGFSRSSTMVYDNTACIYGSGDILVGKILSPELHPIYTPGNETIVIEGKIGLDKNKIPFILPLNKSSRG